MVRSAVRMSCAGWLVAAAMAQTPPKIDFARDIQPLFRQNCYGCHGPSQQSNGLRLDRKSSVFKNGARRVVPGSIQNSLLYHRLTGSEYGRQMPPTKVLSPEQTDLVKAWIEQGAVWPDSLSNEADPGPISPKAASLVESLRSGDRAGFMKGIAADPKLLNARGPGGATPFMYAVLYGDVSLIEQVLKQGANVNARNDAQASALMWAATDLEKTRLLLAHGAEVNVISADYKTPLAIAAGHSGGLPAVKLLLDHGANPNPNKNPMSEGSPLVQAALAADVECMKLLIDRGADVKASGMMAFFMSLVLDCDACVDLLSKKGLPKDAYTGGLQNVAVSANANIIRMLLDHGADVNAFDPSGRTPMMYAAISDLVPVDVVKLLIERGADVNAISRRQKSQDTGMSVLDIARLEGETPVVEALLKAGAKSAHQLPAPPAGKRGTGAVDSISRALPLIQRADAGFTAKSGCISCHNNSMAAMAVGLARSKGVRVDEAVAARQVKTNVEYLQHDRDALYQGHFAAQAGAESFGDTFGPSVIAYLLIGLDAEHYKADLNTDAAAIYLKARQSSAGNWPYQAADTRQPICSDWVGQTALSMRALQLYAPKGMEQEYQKSVRLAADWLAKTAPRTNEDRVWRLFGLAWAGADKAATAGALKDVLGMQRPDGGWSDLPTTSSTAYATGKALVALHTAGVPVSDAAYKHGVEYLLNTQIADGSWFVRTRALALQPYFETGFPHGVDQSMSAAGTAWATMALSLTTKGPAGSSAP